MTATTASARGRANRNKGNGYEADVARYLRQWWPGACRAVRTGSSAAPDPGDIANVPFVVSAKCVATAGPAMWDGWWAELDAMLADDPAALGFIVEKRRGRADPGWSWAHLALSDLVGLYGGGSVFGAIRNHGTGRDRTPVRVRLDDLVGLLVAAGYARGVAS